MTRKSWMKRTNWKTKLEESKTIDNQKMKPRSHVDRKLKARKKEEIPTKGKNKRKLTQRRKVVTRKVRITRKNKDRKRM